MAKSKSAKINVLPNITPDASASNIEKDFQLRGVMQVLHNKNATIEEVLSAANMNFKPLLADITYTSAVSGKTIVSTEAKAVYRDDNDTQVGTVGNRYTPKSYLDAFSGVFGQMVAEGGQPARALSFHGGRRGAIQFKLPDNFNGGGQAQQLWISLINSMDGSTDLCVGETAVTIICGNTFHKAMKDLTAGTKHTKNIDSRLPALGSAIAAMRADFKVWCEQLDKLAENKVESADVELFSKLLFPVKSLNKDLSPNKTAMNKRQLFIANYVEESRVQSDNNLYTLFGAVTRMVDHDLAKDYDLAEGFEYAAMPKGSGQKLKSEALQILNWPKPEWSKAFSESEFKL